MRVRIRRRACITGRCNYRTHDRNRGGLSNEETRNDLSLSPPGFCCFCRLRRLATRTNSRRRSDTGEIPVATPWTRDLSRSLRVSVLLSNDVYRALCARLAAICIYATDWTINKYVQYRRIRAPPTFGLTLRFNFGTQKLTRFMNYILK